MRPDQRLASLHCKPILICQAPLRDWHTSNSRPPSSVTLRQTLMLLFLGAGRYFTTPFLSQFLPLPAVLLSLGAFNRGLCE